MKGTQAFAVGLMSAVLGALTTAFYALAAFLGTKEARRVKLYQRINEDAAAYLTDEDLLASGSAGVFPS